MPSKYKRINLPREPSLEEKLAYLRTIPGLGADRTDVQLVRELVDVGYETVRQTELRRALDRNLDTQKDSVSEAALQTLVDDGLLKD